VPRDQQGAMVHYLADTDKRVCIVHTQFVRQSAASGDHVVQTSRDDISEHQSLVEQTNPELIAVVGCRELADPRIPRYNSPAESGQDCMVANIYRAVYSKVIPGFARVLHDDSLAVKTPAVRP